MTCELSYSSIKNAHFYREQNNKKQQERKRNILYLIENYLKTEGLYDTLQAFQSETHLSNQFTICDNVDLETIVQEYEAYFYLRLNKYPQLTKKVHVTEMVNKRADKTECKRTTPRVKSAPGVKSVVQKSYDVDVQNKYQDLIVQSKRQDDVQFANIVGTPIQQTDNCLFERNSTIFFKDVPDDWKPLVDIISKSIITDNLDTHWNDIIGLDQAKKLLKESIVFPIKYPELFSGLLTPWKGVLLHGAPGTGKTLLAKAVATECKTTFFNISASSLTSKWRGESEKLVRILFELARVRAPSTIFLDELDALISKRDSEEHEASRRLKSELLTQLDGLNQSKDRIFFLATSNIPWELDTAILRRLEKRIHVDIPDQTTRKSMLKYYLPPVVTEKPRLCSELDYTLLASNMDGYSGSDIKIVCKEAAMQSLRDTLEVLEKLGTTGSNSTSTQMKSSIKLNTITTQHVLQALRNNKPCAKYSLHYEQWQCEFGAV